MLTIKDTLPVDEHIEAAFKLHWSAWMVMWGYMLAVMVAISVFFWSVSNGDIWWLALWSAILFSLPAARQFLNLYSMEQGISNKRIIRKAPLDGMKAEDMKLSAIEFVDISQNWMGKLLNYGTLRIVGHGMQLFVLPNIKNPIEAKRQIEIIGNALQINTNQLKMKKL